MKRIFLALFLILVSNLTFSQVNLPVSYDDFVSWAKEIKLSGYPFVESEQEGSDYSAMLGSGPTKALQVRIYDIERFGDYKSVAKQAAVYTWNGYKTVHYEFSGVTFISIELPEPQIAVLFGMMGKVTKAGMEEVVAKSNPGRLKVSMSEAGVLSSGLKWPDVIPSDMRVSDVKSIESLGSDGTYKDVIQVKATMNPGLISAVEKVLKKYNGELNLTSSSKVDFICSDAENLSQLQQDFKTGSLVTFIYYIK